MRQLRGPTRASRVQMRSCGCWNKTPDVARQRSIASMDFLDTSLVNENSAFEAPTGSTPSLQQSIQAESLVFVTNRELRLAKRQLLKVGL